MNHIMGRRRCRRAESVRWRKVMWILAGLAALETGAVALFRSRWKPAIDAVRRFNRRILNPLMLRMAGGPHWYASVIQHTGRNSGRTYHTPVLAERSGSHLFVPLPYGRDVDWLANILAAGHCLIETRGERHLGVEPAVVSAFEAAHAFSVRTRATLAIYGVDEFLRLTLQPAEA